MITYENIKKYFFVLSIFMLTPSYMSDDPDDDIESTEFVDLDQNGDQYSDMSDEDIFDENEEGGPLQGELDSIKVQGDFEDELPGSGNFVPADTLGSKSNLLVHGNSVYLKSVSKKDIKCEIDGKYRNDIFSAGSNTSLLNDENHTIDSVSNIGKQTIDLGFGFEYGAEIYGAPVLTFGLNLRNRMTYGKPDQVAKTANSEVKNLDHVFGSHSHNIGIPVVYVRGADFTIDLHGFHGADCGEHTYMKFGLFPFELGRGIALGAAYSIVPDFITYDPGNTIQEYAPGFMVYGAFDDAGDHKYKTYLSILKNRAGGIKETGERIRSQQYGGNFHAERGTHVYNYVLAGQLDSTVLHGDGYRATLSPYALYFHQGEGNFSVVGDASADMFTVGYALDAESGSWGCNFEVAHNFGNQDVRGLDQNIISNEYRTVQVVSLDSSSSQINTQLSGVPVLVNSNVTYTGDTGARSIYDVQGKKAVYMPGTSGQNAILQQFPRSSSLNGKTVRSDGKITDDTKDLQNSSFRYRDPYVNDLKGWFAVADIFYKTKICDNDCKFACAVGMASGDESPNKALQNEGDFVENGDYLGFVGVQELYSGKHVKSIFLLSGAGQIPRILSVPEGSTPQDNSLGFPERISRFTNIAYAGGSMVLKIDSDSFLWSLNTNVLGFWQPLPPNIYDREAGVANTQKRAKSYLGTELNCYLECESYNIEGLKCFVVGTAFLPGGYYKDLTGVPLDKSQQKFLDRKDKTGISGEFVPTLGHDNACYITCGIEYKF